MTTGEECAGFFRANAKNLKKVHELRKLSEDQLSSWETVSAEPDLSPGPVELTETVARRVFHPSQVSDDGVLTPAIFDDLFNKGFSTDRLSVLSAEQVESLGIAMASARGVKFRGAMNGKVEILRALRTSMGGRVAYVFDTAFDPSANRAADEQPHPIPEMNLPNPAHADVCCALTEKIEQREARLLVWEAFKGHAAGEFGFSYKGR